MTRESAPLDGVFAAPAHAGPSDVTLWWLGQAGVALRHRDTLLLVDPYLSDSLAEKYRGSRFPHNRMVPVPVDPGEVRGVDGVLCTHGHSDHLDPGTLPALQRRGDPVFVVPRAERVRALERGIPPHRLVAVSAGDEVAVGGATVRAVPSAHEELRQDESGDYLALGFVVEIGGLRFYHSGDCVPYDGQPELLRAMAVDVALLPVNGRDAERSSNGVPGNFHWYEAVQLCRDAGIPSLLCHHWGMFSFNTVPPDDLRASLVAEAGDLSWVVPDLGVPYVYPGA